MKNEKICMSSGLKNDVQNKLLEKNVHICEYKVKFFKLFC